MFYEYYKSKFQRGIYWSDTINGVIARVVAKKD